MAITPSMYSGGGSDHEKGWIFPLVSFKNPQELTLFNSWVQHYKRLGIRTKRKYWGGTRLLPIDGKWKRTRFYLDLMVNKDDHLCVLKWEPPHLLEVFPFQAIPRRLECKRV